MASSMRYKGISMTKEDIKVGIVFVGIIAASLLFNAMAEKQKKTTIANEVVSRQDKQFKEIMETLNDIDDSVKRLGAKYERKTD